MKPIKLTMMGFESYKNLTEIDFSKFDKGIFVIAGKTGSGKTTIFDAIKYALFGEASGNDRIGTGKAKKLVNEELAAEVERGERTFKGNTCPFVEFDFEVSGVKYNIRRTIECFWDNNNRKEHKMIVDLKSFDGSVNVSDIRPVNAKIEAILGVNSERFSSVAMIARGEFRKFLNPKKENRIEILKSIFGIDKFKKIEDEIDNAAKNKNSECGKKVSSLKTFIGAIEDYADCDDNEKSADLKEKIFEAQKVLDKKSIDDLLAVLGEFNNFDKASLEKAECEIKENDGLIKNLESKKESIEKYKKLNSEIQNLEKEISSCKSEIDCIKAEKDKLDQRKESIEKLKGDTKILESKLGDYDSKSELEKNLNEVKSRINDAIKPVSKHGESVADFERKKKNLEEQIESIGNPEAEIEKKNAGKADLESQKKNIKNFKDEIDALNTLFLKKEKAVENAEKKAEEWKTASEKANDLRFRFLANRAGFLADEIKSGKPCPVCGNIHPVKLAEKTDDAPTQKAVEDAEKNAEKARDAADKESKNSSKINGEYDTAFNNALNKAKELFGTDKLEGISESIKSKLAEIDDEIQKLDDETVALNKQIEQRQCLETEIKKLESAIKTLNVEETNKTNLEKQLEDLSKKLDYKTKAEAENVIERNKKECKSYDDSVDKNNRELSNKRQHLGDLNGQCSAKKSELEKLPKPDGQDIQSKLDELNDKKECLAKKSKNIYARLTSSKNSVSTIEKTEKEYLELKEESDILDMLSKLARGKGSVKIGFEEYVLSYYFRKIIASTNDRYARLTNGRYRLVVPENGKIDNLKVEDVYNGTLRDASTLSGGERFMAALCLAFAFSTEMSNSNSKLESVFIDEGFGSLDESSLEDTIKILNELGGDKTIGVISHVEDMIKSLPKQIVVTKNGSVSKAEVVIDV